MHLNSLTPMQISGTPWSFLNFGQPPPDIDQAWCEGKQTLLWRPAIASRSCPFLSKSLYFPGVI